MTTGTEKAPEMAPLSLAELSALATVLRPGNPIVGILAALVPLYAIRSNQTTEQVWAGEAMQSVDGIVAALPSVFNEVKLQSTISAFVEIEKAFSPDSLIAKMSG